MKIRWRRVIRLVFQITGLAVLVLYIFLLLLIDVEWHLVKTVLRVEVGRVYLIFKLRRAGVPEEMIREISELVEERALHELDFANPFSYLVWGVKMVFNQNQELRVGAEVD